MRKHGINLILAIICFLVGIVGGRFDFVDVFQGSIPRSNELPVSAPNARLENELTFQDYGVIADGWDGNGNVATFTSVQASDGIIINSTVIYRIPSNNNF